METTPQQVQRVYLQLTFLATFAASVIRGIDALFLLDAGLRTDQVFAVYAFLTAGTVLFEIPTGAVADVKGRRTSYLIGAVSLAASTLAYWFLWQSGAGFIWFALATFLFGIAFTFFSGATEAWLVDALAATGFDGEIESVFAKNQVVLGAAMLVGTLSGGLLAQLTNLGVPYLLRAGLLVATVVLAYRSMHDLGFTPHDGGSFVQSIRQTTRASIDLGLRVAPIRWMTIAGAFLFAVIGFVFYGMQPYLLELYGDESAFVVASIAATIVAGAQILGGISSGFVRRHFSTRTGLILAASVVGATGVIAIGFSRNFYVVIALLTFWSMAIAVIFPVRQAYLNAQIDSQNRATVLSVDSLVTSSGGIVAQPTLGRIAGSSGFGTAFVAAGIVQLGALPFLWLARNSCPEGTDVIEVGAASGPEGYQPGGV